MTTVAWDGKTLAADTLATDPWGLKDYRNKIIRGRNWIAGCQATPLFVMYTLCRR